MKAGGLGQPQHPPEPSYLVPPQDAEVPVGRHHGHIYGVDRHGRADGEQGQGPGRPPPQRGGGEQREDSDQDRLVLGQHRETEQQASADRTGPVAPRWPPPDQRGKRQVPQRHPEHHRSLQQDPVVLPDAEGVKGKQQSRRGASPQRAGPRRQLNKDNGSGRGEQRIKHAHLIDLTHQTGLAAP